MNSKPINKNLIFIITFFVLTVTLILWLDPGLYLGGDQGRYLMFAENITNGYYTKSHIHYNLWNGPGYPLVLAIFKFFEPPLILYRLLNAVFLTFTVYFVSKFLYCEKIKFSFYWTVLFALITIYFNYSKISLILTFVKR